MLALLCDVCGRAITGDGFELTLMPGTVVGEEGGTMRPFASVTAGVISATMCIPCGERITAILHQKLQHPCPTCEVAPAVAAARRGHAPRHTRRQAA